MGQPEIIQGERQWYLITSYGDVVVRVQPGMLVGETAAGELSFDLPGAQLELNIADDGGLLLRAVDDHELESTDGTRCREAHLARHRRAEIRLPHNILRIDTDFVNLPPTDDTVAILAVRSTEDITEPQIERFPERPPVEPVDATVAGRPPQRTTSRSAQLGDNSTADTPLLAPNQVIPLPQRASRPPEPEEHRADDGSANRRTEGTTARRQHIFSPRMAALIGLAAISFSLLYLAVREGQVLEPAAPASTVPAPPMTPAQAPSADAGGPGPGADALPSAVPIPPSPLPLPALEAPPVTEPDGPEASTERPVELLPEPGPVAAPVATPVAPPAIEPIVLPPVERRSIPPIVQTIAQTAGAAETVADPETMDSQPDATVGAEPEEIDERAQAQASEQARRRNLRAADVALAQGRLTTPPEASAYTFYNRVLALDPESPEAKSGLQSVRQGLINRALAQLAGDALDDARKTLQAAADAGANPLLIADLQREVDYRHQLINAGGDAR